MKGREGKAGRSVSFRGLHTAESYSGPRSNNDEKPEKGFLFFSCLGEPGGGFY